MASVQSYLQLQALDLKGCHASVIMILDRHVCQIRKCAVCSNVRALAIGGTIIFKCAVFSHNIGRWEGCAVMMVAARWEEGSQS